MDANSSTVVGWSKWIAEYCTTDEERRLFSNTESTFWLNFVAVDDPLFAGSGASGEKSSSPSSSSSFVRVSAFARDAIKKMLDTALATIPSMKNILFPLPANAVPFSPICGDLFRPLRADTASTTSSSAATLPFRGTIFASTRSELIPDLVLRQGRIEDYDDLMPLLLAGAGVVTPLIAQFRLEELLKSQDEYHQVVVAEDPATKRVVGLMCLKATYDQQQYVVKQYSTESVGKLKPILVPPKAKGQQTGHNAFRISFFFLHPEYDVHAGLFVPKAFSLFPFAEYCFLSQPHANTVHPVLRNFVYFPIKKLQPSTLPGESMHLPEGLFVCCRYSFEATPVFKVEHSPLEQGVAKLLTTQSELSQEAVEIIQTISKACYRRSKEKRDKEKQQGQGQGQGQGDDDEKSPKAEAFALMWRDMVIGVVAGIRCTVDETFALRANFNIDKFIGFEPNGDPECTKFAACDISAQPFEAPRTYYKDDMPGFVIKGFYIRPVFREKIRFLLREVLRATGTEVLYSVLTPKRDDAFPPLLQELTLVPPRRVAEIVEPLEGAPQLAGANPRGAAAGDDDNDDGIEPDLQEKQQQQDSLLAASSGVMSVRCTSRRLLSDEKTVIHARVVVVGASTTGLAVLHTLLHIPYLHFSNLLLISADGLPPHPSTQKLSWNADSSNWTEREYLPLSVGGAVRVLQGSMVDVDRVDKCVFTDNPACEPYDHIVLAVGRQYALPKEFVAAAREASANAGGNASSDADGGDAAGVLHMANAAGQGIPSGCGIFVLNGTSAAENLQKHIRESEVYEDERSRTVIYGNSLDVYAITTSMLELGLAPQRIVIVSPPSATGQQQQQQGNTNSNEQPQQQQQQDQDEASGNNNGNGNGAPFGDLKCAQRVETLLEGLGVQKLRNFLLKKLEFDVDGRLSLVVVETEDGDRSVELDATMMVYAGEKDIDSQVLSALNKRSIVFDGRVIVENTYRTTDRDIYAAGPVAMFSRRFGPSLDFDTFNPIEVGRDVANTVLGCLGVEEYVTSDLLHDDRDYVPKDNPLAAALGYEQAGDVAGSGAGAAPKRPRPLPKYKESLIQRVRLPGGISFFSCASLDYQTILKPATDCEHLWSLSLDAHIGAVQPLFPENNNGARHDVPLAAAPHEAGVTESSYFSVSLGPSKHIERVLYLGTDQGLCELTHLSNLVGMPESAFNLYYNYHETKNSSASTTTYTSSSTSATMKQQNRQQQQKQQQQQQQQSSLDLLRFFRMVRARSQFHDRYAEASKSITKELVKDMVVRQVREQLLDAVRQSGGVHVPDEARRRAVALMTDPATHFRKLTETLLAKFLHEQKQFQPQTLYLPDLRLLLDAVTGEPRIPDQ